MSDNRPSVYWDEARDKWVYRASALGGCLRVLVAMRLGMDGHSHPEWLLERFNESAKLEAPLLDRVTKGEFTDDAGMRSKWKLLAVDDLGAYHDNRREEATSFPFVKHEFADDGQFTMEMPVGDVLIRGHLDGIGQLVGLGPKTTQGGRIMGPGTAVPMGARRVLEGKAFGPDYWRKYLKVGLEGFPEYVMQLSLYMHATGLPALFIVGEKVEDGTALGEVRVEWVDEPPLSLGAVKAKVAKIEALAKKNDVDEVACEPKMWPCPFYDTLHPDGEDEGAGGEMVELDDDEFQRAAEVYKKGADWERQGKAMKDESKKTMAKIAEREGLKGGTKVKTAKGWTLTWVHEEVEESTRVVKAHTRTYPKTIKDDKGF